MRYERRDQARRSGTELWCSTCFRGKEEEEDAEAVEIAESAGSILDDMLDFSARSSRTSFLLT